MCVLSLTWRKNYLNICKCSFSQMGAGCSRASELHRVCALEEQCSRPHPQVQFSPDGRWVVSASFDKAIKLWDGVRGTFVATLRGHVGPVYQVAWSADSRLLVSASKDSTLKVR